MGLYAFGTQKEIWRHAFMWCLGERPRDDSVTAGGTQTASCDEPMPIHPLGYSLASTDFSNIRLVPADDLGGYKGWKFFYRFLTNLLQFARFGAVRLYHSADFGIGALCLGARNLSSSVTQGRRRVDGPLFMECCLNPWRF